MVGEFAYHMIDMKICSESCEGSTPRRSISDTNAIFSKSIFLVVVRLAVNIFK